MASLDDDSKDSLVADLILAQHEYWNTLVTPELHEAIFKRFQLLPQQQEFLDLEKKLESETIISERSRICERLLVLFKEMTRKATIEVMIG